MRILIVTPKYYPDNFSINVISEALQKLGHDITVITSCPFDFKGRYDKRYLTKEVEVINGVKVYRIKAYARAKSTLSLILNYISVSKRISRWVKKSTQSFDIVYTFGISPVTTLMAGKIYKKKYHTKHVAHVLDIWPEAVVGTGYTKRNSLVYKFLYKASKKLYEATDELLIGSPSFKTYLENELGIKDKKITYVPQPALVGHNNDINPYKKDTFNILYSGNISTLQMVQYIVPAMELVKDKNIYFHIVGQGKDDDYISKQIINSNVRQNVINHGYVSFTNIDGFYRYADVTFVGLNNTSFIGKTIPNKLISSFYHAKPVLAMIDGDSKKIIEETGGGVVVNQDIESFAKGIELIASKSKEELRNMGEKNRHYYDDNFAIQIVIKKLLVSFTSK